MNLPFISVSELKRILHERTQLYGSNEFDLTITNAQTNADYQDSDMLIPSNTYVVVRSVAGLPRSPVVSQMKEFVKTPAERSKPIEPSTKEYKHEDLCESPRSPEVLLTKLDPSCKDNNEKSKTQALVNKPALVAVAPPRDDDEKRKIQVLVNTPALNWQCQDGFHRKHRRRLTWRGDGSVLSMANKIPPKGYLCNRCKVPGHFVQYCPTNGDPKYDIKKVKQAAVVPDEEAFEREMEGISSSSSSGKLPLELHCPSCKKVIRDATMTRCCFESFCDKCIRDQIISRSMCFCGAVNAPADDLVPNLSLRRLINSKWWSCSGSTATKSSSKSEDHDSARCLLPKCFVPNASVVTEGCQKPSPQIEENRPISQKSDPTNGNCKRKSEYNVDHEENNRLKRICQDQLVISRHTCFKVNSTSLCY